MSLVDSVESMMTHGLANPKKKYISGFILFGTWAY